MSDDNSLKLRLAFRHLKDKSALMGCFVCRPAQETEGVLIATIPALSMEKDPVLYSEWRHLMVKALDLLVREIDPDNIKMADYFEIRVGTQEECPVCKGRTGRVDPECEKCLGSGLRRPSVS